MKCTRCKGTRFNWTGDYTCSLCGGSGNRETQFFQPTTTDTTLNGLIRARNAMRLKLWEDNSFAHKWLCHDDLVCPDGCAGESKAPNYNARVALYESAIEPIA